MEQASRYASVTVPARALLCDLPIDIFFRARPRRERSDQREHVPNRRVRFRERANRHLNLAVARVDGLVQLDVLAVKTSPDDRTSLHLPNIAPFRASATTRHGPQHLMNAGPWFPSTLTALSTPRLPLARPLRPRGGHALSAPDSSLSLDRCRPRTRVHGEARAPFRTNRVGRNHRPGGRWLSNGGAWGAAGGSSKTNRRSAALTVARSLPAARAICETLP